MKKKNNENHPMQPIIINEHNVIRFRRNKVVEMLLDISTSRGFGLNELALATRHIQDHDENWTQFAQLIGYSVSGAGDLSYFDKKIHRKARRVADKIWKEHIENIESMKKRNQ